MAKLRVGFGSDFNITGQKVGLGTTNPTALLEVAETAKADFNITGVTTLTSYGGFVAQNQRITEPTTIKRTTSKSGTLDSVNEREIEFTELGGVHHGDDQYFNTISEDLVIEEGKILSIHNTEMYGDTTSGKQDEHTHASHVSLGSLEQVSVTGHFSVPCGGINEREETPIEGTVRFNDDLNTLEFFNGNVWRQFTYNQGQSGRGIVGDTGTGNRYQYFNINTLGNTQDFGTWSTGLTGGAGNGGGSDGIRGVWSGGTAGNGITIEYNTIASIGNFIDFGDLVDQSDSGGTASSSTRAVIAGAIHRTPLSGISRMDYIEIQTLGNALEFGNLNTTGNSQCDGFSSPTRGFFEGGGYPTADNSINMITIASKGDAIDFGETTQRASYKRNVSSTTRGIACGGRISYPAGPFSDTIEYITMASTGNAIDFGNLTQARHSPAGAGTLVRGVFCGGYTWTTAPNTSSVNTMDYITIASTGNAQDFGDCSDADSFMSGISDSHGGLGGF